MSIKTNIFDMIIGDKIPCRYTAPTSGNVGYFSELGTCTASEIPVTGTATPDGLFYFIMLGYDSQGRKKLIADRNIQTSISWDALNTAGICSGLPIWTTETQNKYIIRLLTGGISATDADNEWDKIIVGSTLSGTITAGDNNVWNWSGIYSWTSTTNTAGNTYRTVRGVSTSTAMGWGTSNSATGSSYPLGFRPVLLVENIQIIKYLLQYALNIYNLSGTIPSNLADLPIVKTLTDGQTCVDVLTQDDISNYGSDDLSKVLQAKNLFPTGSKYKILKFKSNQ